MKNRRQKRIMAGTMLSAIVLLGGVSVHADIQDWANTAADNDFSNSNNWNNAGANAYDLRNISLLSPNHPIVSAGQSNVVDDVRVGISGDGQLDITGGLLRSDRIGGDDRMGYGNVAVINQSGGTYEIAHELAIGIGNGSDATFNLSGGLLSLQGTSPHHLTIGPSTGSGVLNITGGALETLAAVELYGSGTFSVQGSGATSIGIGSQGSGTAYWNQRSGGTLEALIASNGITPILIDDFDDGGNADVTFAFGSLLEVGFLDGFVESNTWTIMTWEGAVTDNGLQFTTNVNTDVWSWAITNNELQVTYGMGSEPPPTNTPPTGPRTLYWSSDATDMDMTVATNWVENNGGVYESATWGLFEGDTAYIGHNGANSVEGPVYEATYAGNTAELQGELYIGVSRSGTLNFNSGTLDFNSQNRQVKIGLGTRGHGILNVNGGSLEGEAFRVGMDKSSSDGVINLTGGSLKAARGFSLDSKNTSLSLGENGALGELNVSGGSLNVRFGAVLGRNGGTGNVHVEGSAATKIGIGTTDNNSDGFWIQNSGSTLSVAIDEGGVTPIEINGWGNGGAFATFESNSVIDVAWSVGVTNYGVFDVLTWDGDFTDNGLTLSTNVNTSIWSFAFADTDSDGTNDTLRVIADAGTTANGTSILWLDGYYDVPGDFADWDEADLSDTDGDGLLAWEEYIAGTIPTDGNSVLKVTSLANDGADYIITWQSVEGKSYSIITNLSLAIPSPGTAASGIIGVAGETSVTSSIPSAPTVFIEVGVE